MPYGCVRLDDVSFQHQQGSVVLQHADASFNYGALHAILGRNGSGKSTLARLILGILNPDSGTIHRDPGITVPLGAKVPANPFRASDECPNAELSSFGEIQRKQLFTKLNEPCRLILLDEPCTGLDSDGITALESHLGELAALGACIIVTTGSIPLAMSWTDRPYVISEQALVPVDTHELLSDGRVLHQAGLTASWEARACRYGDLTRPAAGPLPPHTNRIAAVVREFLGLSSDQPVKVYQTVPAQPTKAPPLTVISVDDPRHISWIFTSPLCDLSPHLCRTTMARSPEGNAHVSVH